MKKLLLLILLSGFAAVYGIAQSISLADSTGPLANGATIVRTGTPDALEIVAYVFVKNNTANALDIHLKKVELSMVAGSINTFCWGACFGPSVYQTPNPFTVAGNTTDSVNFTGHYTPMGTPGISYMRYVFFNAANPNDSAWVNVDFHAFPLGLDSPVVAANLSNAYPNPASNLAYFTYSMNGSNAAKVLVRNILGTTVREVALSGSEGKAALQVSDLPDGVYFYSLMADGKMLQTRKLVVRH